MRFLRRGDNAETASEKARVTYYLQTNKKLIDVTVIRYADDSPHAAVEDTRSYVLSQWQGVLKRDREEFVRWWVEDETGNVLESHDHFSPPAKPTMWS
jgi:hypothetical protein